MTPSHIGLIFHGIGDPQRDLEPGEAPYWVSVAQFDRILEMIADLPQPDLVRISFDDSNLSDFDIALPRLVERNLKGDFFVLSGRIGQPGSLDVVHIQALEEAGMCIGSHGVAHLDWSALDAAGLKGELSGSRKKLEEICKAPITTAGIPFGRYNARVLRGLRDAGYTCAYSSDRGSMSPSTYLRPRSSVRGDMSKEDVSKILTGQLAPAQRLRRAVGMIMRRVSMF